MQSKKYLITGLLYTLLCSNVVFGQDTMVRYQSAYDSFEQGNYQQALTLFESLLEEDSQNPALIYNLALCYQSLNNFEAADDYFSQLLNDPDYGDWATYQLAMLDWRQGYLGAAEIGLTQVVFNSNDADLVELAGLRYEELLKDMPISAQTNKTWFGNLSLGYGKDSNIVDPRFQNASDEDDNFTEFTASAIKQWQDEKSRVNWQLQGYVFLNRYDAYDGADLSLYNTSIEKYFYSGNWQYSLGLEFERSESGGEDYLGRTALNFTARSNYQQYNQGWFINLQYADIESLSSSFDQLAGSTQRVKTEYRLPIGEQITWRFGLDLSTDERDAIAIGILQSDLSADRQGVFTSLITELTDWRFELSFDYRESDYGDIVRGTFLRINRDDSRKLLLLRADYSLSEKWSLYAEAISVDNDSNVLLFTYQQQTISAGLNLSF